MAKAVKIEIENESVLEGMSAALGIPVEKLCKGFVDQAMSKYAKSMERVRQTMLGSLPAEMRKMVKAQ